MYGARIASFRLLGFETSIELSWSILAVLIAWSLASSVFPSSNQGLSRWTYRIPLVPRTTRWRLSRSWAGRETVD